MLPYRCLADILWQLFIIQNTTLLKIDGLGIKKTRSKILVFNYFGHYFILISCHNRHTTSYIYIIIFRFFQGYIKCREKNFFLVKSRSKKVIYLRTYVFCLKNSTYYKYNEFLQICAILSLKEWEIC